LASVSIGLALGGSAVHESFDTRGDAPSRSAFAGTLGASVGLEVPLPAGVALEGAVGANIHALKQRDLGPEEWITPVTFMSRVGASVRW
jgi:hypothetical protein